MKLKKGRWLMKKWALAALTYLLIIMGIYTAFDQFISVDDVKSEEHGENHTE